MSLNKVSLAKLVVAIAVLGSLFTFLNTAKAQPALPAPVQTAPAQTAPLPSDVPSGEADHNALVMVAPPVSTVTAKAVVAVGINYYVEQGGGTRLYLIKGSTGGRFITESGLGSVNGKPVVGYTDRVQRGETYQVQLTGSGFASANMLTNYSVSNHFVGYLPAVNRFVCPTNTAVKNVSWMLVTYGASVEKPLPIGTR